MEYLSLVRSLKQDRDEISNMVEELTRDLEQATAYLRIMDQVLENLSWSNDLTFEPASGSAKSARTDHCATHAIGTEARK